MIFPVCKPNIFKLEITPHSSKFSSALVADIFFRIKHLKDPLCRDKAHLKRVQTISKHADGTEHHVNHHYKKSNVAEADIVGVSL